MSGSFGNDLLARIERLAREHDAAAQGRPLDPGNDHASALHLVAERQAEKIAAGWDRTPWLC